MKRRRLLQNMATLAAGCVLPNRSALGTPTEIPAQDGIETTEGIREISFGDGRLTPTQEPNIDTARQWWPEQRNVWTPIGWKDHYFRFNVVYNGAIICEPCPHFAPMRPHAERSKGQSFQLTFTPLKNEKAPPPTLPAQQTQLWRLDGGAGLQGWESHATPVLWTEWRLQEGVVVRQKVFSHVKGGGDVVTGIEPHYAWIRLSVAHVDELRSPGEVYFAIQLSRVYYKHVERYTWEDGIAIEVDAAESPYPKKLTSEAITEPEGRGVRILDADNKVRMTVLTDSPEKVQFNETTANIYVAVLRLAAKVDEHIDLLVPMLPEEKEEIEAERKLTYEGALTECNRYWSPSPSSAVRIEVPESYVCEAVARGIKLAEVIAEKDYENGDYTFLTGSWGYDNLWSTPSSMTSHMFLSLLGYHDCVARHVELFRKHQGSVKPPGPSYDFHPGYFSTPRTLTAFDWLTDHGAILHQVSTHALLSRDPEFIALWTEPILKACDFIKDSCARTDHDGVKGLLPPAVATDEIIPTQAVYSLAWHYKGLCSAVQLLKRLGHARAVELDTFRETYKATFQRAFRERAASAPRWTDGAGKKQPKPPTTLSTRPMPYHPFDDAFYLDGGPMILVWAGLMDADDELMKAAVRFFREGPDTALYGYRSNPLARPVLVHEISSCEPCYSWNIFHSWHLGDRQKFLEGMYSLFTGAMSTQTFSACEHRHGIQATQCPLYTAFTLARLAVLDDQLKDGELHLLRLCPLAWISAEQETKFENMPTLYGLVDLAFRLGKQAGELQVRFRHQWKERTPRVVLHVPTSSDVRAIVVNGRTIPVQKQIDLL